jgi:DNA-binding transcriptional LysR family regulator
VVNLRQIQQFAAVAETLNFRKAAEKLHMAQPPLSVSIKRLEDELGTPLFVRERRGLRLTAAGEAIVAHVRQIVFHAEQLKKAAAGAAGGTSGRLRVAFIGSATYTLFPRALPAFRKRYPDVELELREGTTTGILRQVERGELDVGLVRYPVVEATTAVVGPVEHDRLVAALPARSALARKKGLRLADLAQEPFIVYSATAALNLRTHLLAACRAAGFAPRVVQEAVQVQTLLSLVGSGIGVALVPSVSQAQGARGVAFRSLADRGDHLNVAIATVTHADTEPAVAVRFRQLLHEIGGGKPGKPVIAPRQDRARPSQDR